MNHHSVCEEELIAYAAGELCGDDFTRVAAHVSCCDECVSTVEYFRKICMTFCSDDSANPPAETIARAQAIYSPHRLGSRKHKIAEAAYWTGRYRVCYR